MGARLYLSPAVLQYSYGPSHPFQIGRLADLLRMLSALGLAPQSDCPVDHASATRDVLEEFHEPSYLDALEMAIELPARERLPFGLGIGDNPVFPGLWEYCLLTAGGSLEAARWIREGLATGAARRAFVPGGGLHHAHRSRAAGFCYVNDGVLAIAELVRSGSRVLYVDVDAHHGDGVQEAFYATDAVLTLSIHQDGRTLFPGTGFVGEIGEGSGEAYSLNVPLLPASGDHEYDIFIGEILDCVLARYHPDVIVTEVGVDSLRGDPLTRLNWSLHGLDRFLCRVRDTGLPWLAVGGGGYNRWNVVRGWSLVWARMVGVGLPGQRPEMDAAGHLPVDWPGEFFAEKAPIRDVDANSCREHMDSVCELLRQEVLPRIRPRRSEG